MSYYSSNQNYGANDRSHQQQHPTPVPPPRRPPQEPYGFEPRSESYTSQASHPTTQHSVQSYAGYEYRPSAPNSSQTYMHGPRPQAGQYTIPSPPQQPSASGQYYRQQGQEQPQYQAYHPQSLSPQRAPSQHVPYDPRSYGIPTSIQQPPNAASNFTTLQHQSGPPRYNPANYQGTSNAGTMSQTYGPISGSQSVQYHATPHTAPITQPSSALDARPETRSSTSQSPNFTASGPAQQPSSGSAPLPSRPFSFIPEQHPPPVPTHDYSSRQQDADVARSNSSRSGHSGASSQQYSPVAHSRGLQYSSPRVTTVQTHTRQQSEDSGHYSALPSARYQTSDSFNQHPNQRPLPGPPVESQDEPGSASNYDSESTAEEGAGEQWTQERLFNDLENAVGTSQDESPDSREHGRDSWIRTGGTSGYEVPRPLFSASGSLRENQVNGSRLSSDAREAHNSDENDADSDWEAEAGLEAMRIAEEEAQRGGGLFIGNAMSQFPMTHEHDRHGNAEHFNDANQYQEEDDDYDDDDDDVIPVDISVVGGGPSATITYGGDPYETNAVDDHSGDFAAQHPSTSSRSSAPHYADGSAFRTSSGTSITEYSGFGVPAIVDEVGTGGLSDPGLLGRRLSFDEGDEAIDYEDQVYDGRGISSGPPDTFYQPPMTNRPLPPPPPMEAAHHYLRPEDENTYLHHATAQNLGVDPGEYYHATGSSYVPRSISLFSHQSSPVYIPPTRAKTAAEAKRASYRASSYGVESYESLQSPGIGLDLPEIPAARFRPSKLKREDFDACVEPWAMSGVIQWLRAMSDGEVELREHVIVDALLALFTEKIPNINYADAESLAAQVVQEMYKAHVLVKDEEWLKFSGESVTGVIYQLTGQGCYSQALHDLNNTARCYSRLCQRTVKKMDLRDPSTRLTGDWATFHGLKPEDIQNANKKEVERQNVMHEIVQTEEQYMDQLKLLKSLYRESLRNAKPPIVAPTKLEGFLDGVFGKLDAVQKANEDYLLPQLKYRQKEQGPWITGFSDIFRDWIRKSKAPYINYAANFPNANFLVRHEEQKNTMFNSFLESARNHPSSNRLGWDSFLKAPITRLQRYTLLLGTVLRIMPQESPESASLQTAIDEIKTVTLECDARVADMGRKVAIADLSSRLVLRPEMKKANVDLKLNQMGRELLFRGDLQRTGGTRFTWLETHTFLFDNFLVLAKTVYQRDSSGGPKYERYDVSKSPIPMDVLVLESTNDDPVVKSFKGTATVSGPPRGVGPANTSSVSANSLTHTSTNGSVSTVDSTSSNRTTVTTTSLDGPTKDEKILYPFRVKHLGRDPYTLFAASAQNRKEWCDKIIEAKTKHAASLFAQNAEPFRLRVLADTAFSYDIWSGGPKTVLIKGTPLSRAIDEVERTYAGGGRPGPVCRAKVNCATTFHQLTGKQMVAVGTDYGVYITEFDNPRAWTRAISALKVTQLAVIEEFNLFLLISDKALIAYHLDVVCHVASGSSTEDSIRKAPQKLSGARDVGFFVTGRMKDRILLFYKKRDGMSSNFKILEPILQKSTTAKARSFSLRRGTTDFFREYDEFYIPTECNALSLFNSSLSAATVKGFEVLNLDKKTPWSVPDLSAPSVSSIATRLNTGGNALAMFRLDDTEFLCVYEHCAVYVDKHGDISRGVVMEFVGHARSAALEAGYLVLFDNDFVEIRDAGNGRLKQVISGQDVRCLDDGKGGMSNGAGAGTLGRTVKFAMQHPEQERSQLVLELVLNESRRS